MSYSYRILIFADPRRMGEEAYECYRAWHRDHDDTNILWVGYNLTDSEDCDLVFRGRKISFDSTFYDKSARMLEGKGWRILPRANALIFGFDSERGKSVDIRDLGSISNQFVRKLQSIMDTQSAIVAGSSDRDITPGEVALEGAFFATHVGLDSAPAIIEAVLLFL